MEATNVDDEEFGFSRNYFLGKELSGSGKKSKHKLADINGVDEHELREVVANIESRHKNEIAALVNSYRSSYPDWVFELRCDFSLLMYGFGSKKSLIEDFTSTSLYEFGVVVINGYIQPINLKQVVITLAEMLLDQLKDHKKAYEGNMSGAKKSFNLQSMDDIITFLNGPHVEGDDCFICVVIHNIDGPGLRDPDTQQCLARIAACYHIRVIASIDHVNTPLLWDKKMVHTQFNWYWHHVPTFAPYKVEGMFHPLIFGHSGSAQSVKNGFYSATEFGT